MSQESSLYWAYLSHTAPSPEALQQQRALRLPDTAPRWSIVLADGAEGADATYTSLAAQTYPRWELCVAGEGKQWLERRPNVRTAELRKGETALMAALRRANGTHLLILFAGDRLAPDALYRMSERIAEDPAIEIVYADEDALLPGGERGNPLFKPAFSPETLLSFPYMGRMVGYARGLFEDVGGIRDLDGLYDLSLRASERAEAIAHIPRILLTAATLPAPLPLATAKAAVQAALDRRGVGHHAAAGAFSGSIAIERGLTGDPRVSVIVADTVGWRELRRLLESIESRSAYERYELLVVHDGRIDADTGRYFAMLEKHRAARVFACDAGAAAMRDYGARRAGGDFLLFLDGGLEMETADAFYRMAALAAEPGVGAVGGKLVTKDGRIASAGLVIGLYGWQGVPYRGAPEHPRDPLARRFVEIERNVSAVSGDCLMIAHDRYRAAGGLDPTFADVGWDAEFCLRLARRGLRAVYTPAARFVQHAPRPERPPTGQDRVRCLDAFRPILTSFDPYYGPQYDYAAREPRLAVPMRPPIEAQEG